MATGRIVKNASAPFWEDTPSHQIYALEPGEHQAGLYELDHWLHKKIVLGKKYSEGGKSKQVWNPSRRRGRTIDILLKQPVSVKGIPDISWSVMSFKGAGAMPVPKGHNPMKHGTLKGEYLIDPFQWHDSRIKPYGRFFGAVRFCKARHEAMYSRFKELGIPHTPYVAINQFPDRMEREIYCGKPALDREPLFQIVRLSQTNIRFYDSYFGMQPRTYDSDKVFLAQLINGGFEMEKLIHQLGVADGKTLRGALVLEGQNRFMKISNRICTSDDRFITGEFTDFEGWEEYSQEENEYAINYFLSAIEDSLRFLKRFSIHEGSREGHIAREYCQLLSSSSGYDIEAKGPKAMSTIALRYIELREKARDGMPQKNDPVLHWKQIYTK
ncbi:hypothetical protein HYU14_07365 [Candidatus Woesearchaeota archaeon]|nr:hypothetical protein [Candidatus Woesearchaeota archaeon]